MQAFLLYVYLSTYLSILLLLCDAQLMINEVCFGLRLLMQLASNNNHCLLSLSTTRLITHWLKFNSIVRFCCITLHTAQKIYSLCALACRSRSPELPLISFLMLVYLPQQYIVHLQIAAFIKHTMQADVSMEIIQDENSLPR